MSVLSTAAASSAVLAVKEGAQYGLSPLMRTLALQPWILASTNFKCRYSSSSSDDNASNASRDGKGSSRSKRQTAGSKQQQQQHSKQHQSISAAAGSLPWPTPSKLVLPSKKATAPVLGRVPPSSNAAAAATAQMLRAANPPMQPKVPEVPESLGAHHGRTSSDTAAAAAAQVESRSTNASTSGSSSSIPRKRSKHVQRQQITHAYPWEVVANVPGTSPYPLEAMAEMDITLYMDYMRAARLGMSSVFELGVVREQGFRGRMQLLRREQLLQYLLQQLQHGTNTADHATLSAATQQEEYSSNDPDELLQELTQEQFEAAGAAASAAHAASAGATADEVADCLLDYFVFKRCAQLMLLQRQHRMLMQQQHQAFLQQQQHQDGGVAESAAAQPPFSAEDLAAVDIWDAFFDATLVDYLHYLDLAVAGAPSVFTTVNTNAPDVRQQQQPQTETESLQQQQEDAGGLTGAALTAEQHYAACELLFQSTDILRLLPNGMMHRPGLLIGKQQLLNLAAGSRSSVADVAEVLQDFYKLKRLGFRAALEQLMEVADEHSALQRF